MAEDPRDERARNSRRAPKEAAKRNQSRQKKAQQKETRSKRPKAEKPQRKSRWSRFWAEASVLQKGLVAAAAAVTAASVIGGAIVKFGGEVVRPVVSGARLTLSATCQSDKIQIAISNGGGRAAWLKLPQFTIHSSRRPNEPLGDYRAYLKDPPVGDRFEVPSDRQHPLEYNNPLDFFGSREAANACRYELVVPVEGRTEPLRGSCPCIYVER